MILVSWPGFTYYNFTSKLFSSSGLPGQRYTLVKSKLSYLIILKQGCHEGKHRSMRNKYRDDDGCNRKSGPLEIPCIRRWFGFCWTIKVKNEKLENKNHRSINRYHLTYLLHLYAIRFTLYIPHYKPKKVLERKITKNEQISVWPIEGYGKIGWYGIQMSIAFGSESIDGNVILAFDWLEWWDWRSPEYDVPRAFPILDWIGNLTAGRSWGWNEKNGLA
jgi:hypothetical protein